MLETTSPPVLKQLVDEYAELVRIKEAYYELIFSVETKHPQESRHQTALRYIKQAENHECNPPQQNWEI